MEDKKKVPRLRFPGFTDDWEQRKVSDEVDSIAKWILSIQVRASLMQWNLVNMKYWVQQV